MAEGTHKQRTIERIRSANLVHRLLQFVRGEIEMSSVQVRAALALINKTLPDLKAIEHSGEVTHKRAEEMTNDELVAIITRASGAGATESAKGERKPH